MSRFLILLAVAVNAAELSLTHQQKMNLVVVDKSGKLVYPAREMDAISTQISQIEEMSHKLDMKLQSMEELNLRDPEVWAKYTKVRDAARTASTELDAMREKMYVLEDQYVDAERKMQKMMGSEQENNLILQAPGDVALLQTGEDEEDYQGEGPTKEEYEKEQARKEQFKLVAEGYTDAIEEKLVETPGISKEEAEEEVNDEKAWNAADVEKGQSLLQTEEEETEEEKEEEKIEKAERKVKSKAIKPARKSMFSLVETSVENKLVSDSNYEMALYLAEEGLSMEQIADELHPVEETEAAEKAQLSETQLEEAEQKRREAEQEKLAAKNMKLLGIAAPRNLKIKTQVSKEAEWRAQLEAIEQRVDSTDKHECLNTADEEKNHNNEDLQLEKIFFINLDKSGLRRKTIEERLHSTTQGKYKVERWTASGNGEADVANFKEFSRSHQVLGMVRKGTIATYLSHVRLMKHIAEQKDGVYMVLEDDAQPKSEKWADEVMCQVRELPENWDVYKFGYWKDGAGCDGVQTAGKFSCLLDKYTLSFMGTQGLAYTPKGAKAMLAHLYEMPVYDVDGAMMSAQNEGRGVSVDANLYASKRTYLKHDQSLDSAQNDSGHSFMVKSLTCDMENKKDLCLEEEEQNNDDDGRESSFAASQRVARNFLSTGKMPWEVTGTILKKDWNSMAALV